MAARFRGWPGTCVISIAQAEATGDSSDNSNTHDNNRSKDMPTSNTNNNPTGKNQYTNNTGNQSQHQNQGKQAGGNDRSDAATRSAGSRSEDMHKDSRDNGGNKQHGNR